MTDENGGELMVRTPDEATTYRLDYSAMGSPDADYTHALTDVTTLEQLRALVTVYAELAVDAVPVVQRMTDDDFAEFRKGMLLERKKKFAGEAWAKKFGAVLMPMPMMQITQVADHFKAPFGVTWQRLKDLRPDLLAVI